MGNQNLLWAQGLRLLNHCAPGEVRANVCRFEREKEAHLCASQGHQVTKVKSTSQADGGLHLQQSHL